MDVIVTIIFSRREEGTRNFVVWIAGFYRDI